MIYLHRTAASTKFTAVHRGRITCRVELSPEEWFALGGPEMIEIDIAAYIPDPDDDVFTDADDQPIDLS